MSCCDILTDEQGRPIERPSRTDFASDWEYANALHAWNDRVTNIANEAFDAGWRNECASW
jgi:hypothetical protein